MNTTKAINQTVDMIQLQDLMTYQDIKYRVLRGIYWNGKRDHRIREYIKHIFNQRAQFKKEGNSIQEVLKLIMNSGYGKSIQKPIVNEIVFKRADKADHYQFEHWHQIVEKKYVANDRDGAEGIAMFKIKKNIDNQFNNAVFGVSVLSMSKRIMNEVMCLAEDLGINIWYQDTDSMHIQKNRLSELSEKFKLKFGRELIGATMGCFHNDFDELTDGYATMHISLGKKMYYDKLTNSKGEFAEHFRMKGIPNNVIIDHVNKNFGGKVENLYRYMFEGHSIVFDLMSCQVRFAMEKTGKISHVDEFKRRVKATCPKITE
jgi:hypothetical protein